MRSALLSLPVFLTMADGTFIIEIPAGAAHAHSGHIIVAQSSVFVKAGLIKPERSIIIL